MFFGGTPAAMSWRRLASARSTKIFFGKSLCPGAREVRNKSGYFSWISFRSLVSRWRPSILTVVKAVSKRILPPLADLRERLHRDVLTFAFAEQLVAVNELRLES